GVAALAAHPGGRGDAVAESAALFRACGRGCAEPRGPRRAGAAPLTADLAHVALLLDEAGLVDQVAGPPGVGGATNSQASSSSFPPERNRRRGAATSAHAQRSPRAAPTNLTCFAAAARRHGESRRGDTISLLSPRGGEKNARRTPRRRDHARQPQDARRSRDQGGPAGPAGA